MAAAGKGVKLVSGSGSGGVGPAGLGLISIPYSAKKSIVNVLSGLRSIANILYTSVRAV